eukprot:CAMPEP_0197320818 /NCGR_PEP_ID=MMETSP0891-20130614/61797_1 /TAXON_ID=44058 ORGANISM="Aureoumbra lagunensis, Strain CCMP1510" /NCGR_SAMPLE_ID=MMETSP0891 /ASSEMBLY_ACC=CAM_ASM_000534 /LENGTH=784 /DNA_ID=CAMNT_0042812375 /DNA_START=596 /DNA_END=2950 /DNA_ORIENTATION=-
MNDNDLEWLQDSDLIYRAQQAKQNLRSDFERLSPTLRRVARVGCSTANRSKTCPLFDLAGFNAFSWARGIIDSRALTFRGKRVLAPFADMVNYAPLPRARQYDAGSFFLKYHYLDDQGNLHTRADRDCLYPGLQFLEDYGDNSNLIYLEYHGFVPQIPNPFNCVNINLPSLGSSNDELFRWRVTALKVIGETGPPSSCLRATSLDNMSLRRYAWALEQSSTDLLEACVALWQQNEQSSQCSKSPSLSLQGTHLLCTAIDEAADKYPTTLAEDERIVKKLNISSGAKLALNYRIGQKRIIEALRSQCDQALDRPLRLESLRYRVAVFNDWIQSQNWPVLKIEAAILPTHGGRLGAVVSDGQKVARGEAYLSIPVDTACMDAAAARRLLGTAIETLDDFHALLVLLLHETLAMITDGKLIPDRSEWGPYLLLLPGIDRVLQRVASVTQLQVCSESDDQQCRHFFTVTPKRDLPPLLWADDEATAKDIAGRWLRGSALQQAVPRYVASVRRDWQQASVTFRAIPNLRSKLGDDNLELILDFSLYRWAYQVIDSRSIWWAGSRHLVPMLDLVNAAATDEMPANAPVHRTTLDEQATNAITYAATSFASGEQLLEDYGQPNHVLFLYHGFILPVNKHDCVRIDLEIPFKDDPTYLDSVRRRLHASRFMSPYYTTCLKPGLFTAPSETQAKEQHKMTVNRLFTFLAIKHDLELPTKAGPSLQLILILADEIHSRLNAYTSKKSDDGDIKNEELPTSAKMLLDIERTLLTDIYDEIADQARHHEAFIRLKR